LVWGESSDTSTWKQKNEKIGTIRQLNRREVKRQVDAEEEEKREFVPGRMNADRME
jgi:hypothetical protein